MIDELKMFIELLGNLGIYAFWGVIAYLFFKLATLASWVMLLRYLITKLYDWATNYQKRPISKALKINGHLITHDDTAENLVAVLLSLKKGSDYIHQSDVRWLETAIKEKRQRDELASK